jgi:AraC-like DNA-binding protein
MGELQIANVTGTGIWRVIRSSRQIARAPADLFQITVQLAGRTQFSQGGREVTLKPGDLALHDSARPFCRTFEGKVSQIVLQMPRAALQTRLGAAECFTAIRVGGETGIGSILSSMLGGLPAHLPAISAETRERLAGNLIEIIATTLLAHGTPVSVSAERTLTRVKLWVEIHLGEEISAERIASSCGLSCRHLNRLFEREGSSPMHYVWGRRLAHCHRNLIDPAMRHRSIGEIAFTAGFNDLSHFSRSYKARYSCSPRDARRGAIDYETRA